MRWLFWLAFLQIAHLTQWFSRRTTWIAKEFVSCITRRSPPLRCCLSCLQWTAWWPSGGRSTPKRYSRIALLWLQSVRNLIKILIYCNFSNSGGFTIQYWLHGINFRYSSVTLYCGIDSGALCFPRLELVTGNELQREQRSTCNITHSGAWL